MPEQTGDAGAQGAASGPAQGATTQPQGGDPEAQGAPVNGGGETVESLRQRISTLEGENARYRRNAKARDDAEQERSKGQQTEAERMAARVSDLEEQLKRQQSRAQEQSLRLATIAVAQRLGFRNPDLAYRLMDPKAIEYDDEGEVKMSTVEAALGSLARTDPYLMAATDFGGGQRGGSAAAPANDMNAILRSAAGKGR